jgi:type IV pilus assembly protein PilA
MKKLLKSSEGFTLVELMVVVAIIGILSAVAIPNFKKYQAKSKQSEAKIALAALYTAEVGASADYDTYGTCILELGYETPPKGYYIVGFSARDTTSTTQIGAKLTTCNNTAAFAVAPTAHVKANSAATLATSASLTASVAPTSTLFTAAAAGNIAQNTTQDQWTINASKNLDNSTVGF